MLTRPETTDLIFLMEISKSPAAVLKRYGLVILGFIHLAVGRGLHGTFGVFYVALLDAFGWSRGATAAAVSLAYIFEGMSMPVVGFLTDRLGGRKTLLVGGAVLALGLGLSATISSLWQLYLWVGIVTALGHGLIGMVPHVAIISREFATRRATALGIAYAGGGVGLFFLVPATQLMISNWGWEWAYIGLAGIVALIIIPSTQLFFHSTTDPASAAKPVQAEKTKEGQIGSQGDWTVKQALRTPAFWMLFGSRVLASMGNQIVVTHQIAHAVDLGYTKIFAASIYGLMGIVSILGRLGFGYLSDVMRREVVFAWVQTVSSLGIVALLVMRDDSWPALLYIYAVFYGLGQGSRALVLSAISADIFLGKSFGAIYGYFTLSIGVGGATGAWLGGFLFDVTHSYTLAFSIALACFLVSVFIVWQSSRTVNVQRIDERS